MFMLKMPGFCCHKDASQSFENNLASSVKLNTNNDLAMVSKGSLRLGSHLT